MQLPVKESISNVELTALFELLWSIEHGIEEEFCKVFLCNPA